MQTFEFDLYGSPFVFDAERFPHTVRCYPKGQDKENGGDFDRVTSEGIRALLRENAELRARMAKLEEAAKKQTRDMDILLRGGLEAQHRGAVENSRLRKRIEELEQEVKRTCVHVQAPLPN